MSSELLLSIGGLSLLDTLSPAIIGVTLYVMITQTTKRGSRLLVYLITVTGLYFVLGLMLMLGLGILMETFTSLLEHRAVSWTLFIAGILLFAISFFIKPSTGKAGQLRPRSAGILPMIALGVSTFILEAGTAFPYFAAIGLMTTSNLALVEWLPILIGYQLVMMLPAILLYMLSSFIGPSVHRWLQRMHNWLVKQSGSMLSWILCIAGLILIFNSLDYL
ncbi:GAP family protein [Paenibacillus lemnae]|uniref:GAP family protein n=1 Tax=Paenibacillus lemnae TaxID=1330551 RepID=A0A848M993_PAELE|nr:GAP family protein [Paenibacillus lemnae]NMO96740.1 hypothetical protein [Paenibacillus lemnae]